MQTFIIAALVGVAILVVVVSFIVIKTNIQHERIRTVANIVSAGAAVTIPIVLYQAAERSRLSDIDTARDTRTLQVVTDLDHRVAELVASKSVLDRTLNADGEVAFSFGHIDQAPELRKLVYGILNEYEAVCVGVNQNLLSLPIVWAMRGDALIATYKEYGAFITQHRQKKKENANAWTDCVELVRALDSQKQNLNAKADAVKNRRAERLKLAAE